MKDKTNKINAKKGAFRFAYFTDKYKETCDFYVQQLELPMELSWNRNENDKGAVFNAGAGLIEILHLPDSNKLFNPGLDYRTPKGAFMVVEVWEIDALYRRYKDKDVQFKQEITDQPWGHRSFSMADPNGVVLFFYEEIQ